MEKRRAIVLGAHLSVIQELGKHGVECIGIDFNRSVSTYSRYCKFRKCPNPMLEVDKAVSFLYDLCRERNDRPVLIPVSDPWTLALAKHREMFMEVSEPCVAGYEAVDLLMNKERFCRWGCDRGYMTPRPWTLEEALALPDDRFPIMAKPVVRKAATNEDCSVLAKHMDRLRFVPLHDRKELNGFVQKEKEMLPHLSFQEYVRGMTDRMYSIGAYLDRSSEIKAMFIGHKVRGFPASHGDCVVGESTTLPDPLIDNLRKLSKELKLTGLAEYEYKQDSITGEFKLIEINPRAWLWIGITPLAGVSVPLIAYNDLAGIPQSVPMGQWAGSVKFVRVLDDLPNCLYRYKTDHPEWSMTFTEWLRDIKADRRLFLEFSSGDWLVSAILMFQTMVRVGADMRFGASKAISRRFDRNRMPPKAVEVQT